MTVSFAAIQRDYQKFAKAFDKLAGHFAPLAVDGEPVAIKTVAPSWLAKETSAVDWAEAGRKSWVTRRANEKKKRLSAGAIKAHATRRANKAKAI